MSNRFALHSTNHSNSCHVSFSFSNHKQLVQVFFETYSSDQPWSSYIGQAGLLWQFCLGLWSDRITNLHNTRLFVRLFRSLIFLEFLSPSLQLQCIHYCICFFLFKCLSFWKLSIWSTHSTQTWSGSFLHWLHSLSLDFFPLAFISFLVLTPVRQSVSFSHFFRKDV